MEAEVATEMDPYTPEHVPQLDIPERILMLLLSRHATLAQDKWRRCRASLWRQLRVQAVLVLVEV